jgi:amino acid transporter
VPQAVASLQRALRLRDVLFLALSGMSPAASVFVTGSAIVHIAGTGAAAALIGGGIAVILVSLLAAELGAAYPSAGGIYPAVASVLGPGASTVVMTLALVAAPATLAFCALGLADYVRALDAAVPKIPIALAALSTAVLLSVLRIKTNAWITGACLAAEFISVTVLAIVASLYPVRHLSTVLLHPVMLGPAHTLIATPPWTMVLAMLASCFACSGSILALSFAEELRGPPARIGWAVVSVGVAGSCLVVIPLVLLTTSAPNLAATFAADAPIASFLATAALPALATFTTLVVALAIMNNIVASMLSFSRLLYATGRDGTWPAPAARWLSQLHGQSASLWRPAAALGITAALLCLIGERALLVILSGDIFSPTLLIIAVIAGRKAGLTGAKTFRSPLFPVPALICLCLLALFLTADWLDPTAGRPSLLLLGGIAVLAAGYHRYAHRHGAPGNTAAVTVK